MLETEKQNIIDSVARKVTCVLEFIVLASIFVSLAFIFYGHIKMKKQVDLLIEQGTFITKRQVSVDDYNIKVIEYNNQTETCREMLKKGY